MRLVLVGVATLAILVGGGLVSAAYEQTVEPLDPGVEQRVEVLGGQGDQRVEPVDPAQQQGVGPYEPPTPAAKAATQVGRVLVGLTAVVLALGVTAAQLLLL